MLSINQYRSSLLLKVISIQSLNKIQQVEKDLLAALNSRHGDLMNAMRAEKQMSAENEAKVTDIVKNFVASYKV